MKVFQRAKGLMLTPRRSWDDIAAEGDSTRFLVTRYVPLLALASLAIAMVLYWLVGASQPEQTEIFMRRPDGSLMPIGTRTTTSIFAWRSALIIVPLYGVLTVIGVAAMRGLILMNAPRFAAVPDGVAATKLAAYAPTAAWIGLALLFTPFVGLLLATALWGYSIFLFYVGAPRLLPPHAEEHKRFGRSIAIRAILVCLGLLLVLILALFASSGGAPLS
jgi:hypothetical protein